MYVMGSGGDFLERPGNQEDLEIGKERGKACSSCFPENIRCMYVPVSWQVGSTAEGQMTCGWEQRGGVEDPTPLSGSRKTPQTAQPLTVVCYSGGHQELAEGKHA